MKDKETVFKKWVMDHSAMMYSYATQHRFDADGAKDLVQDTFLAAWRNMDNYKSETSAKNWLFIILKNKIKDHFRKSVNRMEIASIHHDHNDHTYFDEADHWANNAYPKSWEVNFSDPAETKEFYDVFRSCGGKLKQIQHAVFVMKYIDGLESEDICKHLGITASNYWVIIHRAKVQLRACLQKNWINK